MSVRLVKCEETTTYKCYEFSTECKRLTTAINRMCKEFPKISEDIKELKNSYEWYGGNFNECDDTTTYGNKQAPTYRFIVEFDGEHCYICMYYFTNNEESDTKDTTDTTEDTTDTTEDTTDTTEDTTDTTEDTTDNFQIVPLWVYSKYNINPLTALIYALVKFLNRKERYISPCLYRMIDDIIIIDDTFLSEELPF